MGKECELKKLREALQQLNAPRPQSPSIAHLPIALTLEALTSADPFAELGALVDADAAVQNAKAGNGSP